MITFLLFVAAIFILGAAFGIICVCAIGRAADERAKHSFAVWLNQSRIRGQQQLEQNWRQHETDY